jgi:hypothetical protein
MSSPVKGSEVEINTLGRWAEDCALLRESERRNADPTPAMKSRLFISKLAPSGETYLVSRDDKWFSFYIFAQVNTSSRKQLFHGLKSI